MAKEKSLPLLETDLIVSYRGRKRRGIAAERMRFRSLVEATAYYAGKDAVILKATTLGNGAEYAPTYALRKNHDVPRYAANFCAIGHVRG